MEKRIAGLKAGDIVKAHGGTFRVLTDAAQSEGHRDSYWDMARRVIEEHPGPVDCAFAQAQCIAGLVAGYFWPGSGWTFQGTTAMKVAVAA